jgi:iron complex outermembrane receptor protein
LTYHQPQLAEHWDFTAQASYLHNFWGNKQLYMMLPPGSGGGAYPDGRLAKIGYGEAHSQVKLSTFYTGWLNHTLRLEAGYVYADIYKIQVFRNFDNQTKQWLGQMVDFSDTPAASLPEKLRQNWHLFVQDAWRFQPDWELTAGWRYYHYTDFGNTSNPNLGLVWQTNSRLVTKLLYARAFRAPSIAELYANSSVDLGNRDLKPEIIDTIELAWDYQATPQLQLSGDVFYNNTADGIDVVTTPGQQQQYRNLNSKTGYGLSLEAQWKFNKSLTLQGHYDFQTASDQNDHHIPNAPRHKFYFRTDWQFLPGWNVDLQANWVGQRYRPTGDTRPPVDDYTTVDLTLRYQQEKQPWEVGLSVRNMFDADAREPSDTSIPNDLPLAGRSLWGEVRYRF